MIVVPVWIANVDREELHEGKHGKTCPCILCLIENGPPKYFAEGPPQSTGQLTREDLIYLGFVGLYRLRRKPWKTPKTNTEGTSRVGG